MRFDTYVAFKKCCPPSGDFLRDRHSIRRAEGAEALLALKGRQHPGVDPVESYYDNAR